MRSSMEIELWRMFALAFCSLLRQLRFLWRIYIRSVGLGIWISTPWISITCKQGSTQFTSINEEMFSVENFRKHLSAPSGTESRPWHDLSGTGWMVLLLSYGLETRGEQCATYVPTVLLTTSFPWNVMGSTLFGAFGSFFRFLLLENIRIYSLIPLHRFPFHKYKTVTNPNWTGYKNWTIGAELHRCSSIHNKIGTRLRHTTLILMAKCSHHTGTNLRW